MVFVTANTFNGSIIYHIGSAVFGIRCMCVSEARHLLRFNVSTTTRHSYLLLTGEKISVLVSWGSLDKT